MERRAGRTSEKRSRREKARNRNHLLYRISGLTIGAALALGLIGASVYRGFSNLYSSEQSQTPTLPAEEVPAEVINSWATAMENESSLSAIAYAGWLLEQNQQGLPSFSTINSVFTDDPIQFDAGAYAVIKTSSGSESRLALPMATKFEPTGTLIHSFIPSVQAHAQDLEINSPSHLRFSLIAVDLAKVNSISVSAREIILAQQVLTAQSIDKVMGVTLEQDFQNSFKKPTDPEILRAYMVRRYSLDQGNRDQPFWQSMFDSYIQVLVDYAKIKDNGLFQPGDLNYLATFDQAEKIFRSTGALLKVGDKYTWTTDQDAYDQGWATFTYNQFKILKGS